MNRQVADSACTATAYLGGVKGNYGTIGVNAHVPRYDCNAGQNPAYWVDSIGKWAQDAGKDAGFVTTSRVTHASPAGVYAHTAQRGWENDAEITGAGYLSPSAGRIFQYLHICRGSGNISKFHYL